MTSHCGKVSKILKISNKLFWHVIKDDVKGFIKKCDEELKKQEGIKKVSKHSH